MRIHKEQLGTTLCVLARLSTTASDGGDEDAQASDHTNIVLLLQSLYARARQLPLGVDLGTRAIARNVLRYRCGSPRTGYRAVRACTPVADVARLAPVRGGGGGHICRHHRFQRVDL